MGANIDMANLDLNKVVWNSAGVQRIVRWADSVEKTNKSSVVDEANVANLDFALRLRLWGPERETVPTVD